MSETLRLTRAELCALTERKQRGKVCAWLVENHYPHDLDANGWPIVLRSYVEVRLGGAPQKREPRLRLATA